MSKIPIFKSLDAPPTDITLRAAEANDAFWGLVGKVCARLPIASSMRNAVYLVSSVSCEVQLCTRYKGNAAKGRTQTGPHKASWTARCANRLLLRARGEACVCSGDWDGIRVSDEQTGNDGLEEKNASTWRRMFWW